MANHYHKLGTLRDHNRAVAYLNWRYDGQVALYPRTAEIPRGLYVARNLASLLRSMQERPRTSERPCEAWEFDL